MITGAHQQAGFDMTEAETQHLASQTLKIRNQDFDTTLRQKLTNLTNGPGKNPRAAHIIVIAIHAGHNRMLQSQLRNRFRNTPWFVQIDWPRSAFGHSTESAAPGADIPEQHKSCRAVVPALTNIRTLRRLANCMQSQAAR